PRRTGPEGRDGSWSWLWSSVAQGEGDAVAGAPSGDEGRQAQRIARIARVLDVFLVQDVVAEGLDAPVPRRRGVAHPQVQQAVAVLIFVLHGVGDEVT